MSAKTEEAKAWSETATKQAFKYWELFAADEQRFVTWLILGHTGALVFTYQAKASGQVCDDAAIGAMAATFSTGLGIVFFAALLNLFVRWRSYDLHWERQGVAFRVAHNRAQYDELVEEDAEQQELDDIYDVIEADEKKEDDLAKDCFIKLRPWIVFLALVLLLVSAILFIVGATAPLRQAPSMCGGTTPPPIEVNITIMKAATPVQNPPPREARRPRIACGATGPRVRRASDPPDWPDDWLCN
ncbi:hypothetical protein U91I_03761 [alpha proteobacterium U9-1i]|nr:hypothetical protein U91I_03761 [alpha proteobacterium U9-1i]